MMDVVFSRSACGSLKMAQHYGQGEYTGTVGVIYAAPQGGQGAAPAPQVQQAARQAAEQRARREWENAHPLGGDPANVFSLEGGWSMGDIAESQFPQGRRRLLERLFAASFSGSPAEQEQIIRESLDELQANLQTVLERSARGEEMRIWYSDNPDDACGLCWLLAKLHGLETPGPVTLIKLPVWEYGEDETVMAYTGWGEISPGEWGRYLPLAQPARPVLLRACAARWQQLQRENAPLRVCLNGGLQSVPENFYDDFILRELDRLPEEFLEASLVGNVLGRCQLGIGDSWIALRIEAFCREGLLEVVQHGPGIRRRLRQCTADGDF